MQVHVITHDYSREYLDSVRSKALTALSQCGMVIERSAQDNCPVDTGRLRNSISNTVNGGDYSVDVGSRVEYAIYVEMGTRKMAARPYLKTGLDGSVSTCAEIIKNAIG